MLSYAGKVSVTVVNSDEVVSKNKSLFNSGDIQVKAGLIKQRFPVYENKKGIALEEELEALSREKRTKEIKEKIQELRNKLKDIPASYYTWKIIPLVFNPVLSNRFTTKYSADYKNAYVPNSDEIWRIDMTNDNNLNLKQSTNKEINSNEPKVINQSTEIKPKIDSSKKINIYAGTKSFENAELSNFANRPFKLGDGVTYPTVEHAFQLEKLQYSNAYTDGQIEAIVRDMNTKSAAQAKAFGKTIKGLDVKRWNEDASKIMKGLIIQSFQANPNALAKLLATGNATLTHTQESPKSKWRTEFPRLLMEVRDELRTTQPSTNVKGTLPRLDNNIQGTLFSLKGIITEKASEKLDNILMEYLKPFNIKYDDINKIKERYNVDSLGTVDIIQKVMYLAEERDIQTLPEEFSHLLVMLMGESNPMIEDLLINISSWSGYNDVLNKYNKRYQGNIKKIKVEAIGQLIGKAIVSNFKSENKEEQSWFTKIKNAILNFFTKVSEQDKLINNIANRIAKDVLKGKQLIDIPELGGKKPLVYDKILADYPIVKQIVNKFSREIPFKLVGSLAIAKEQNIYRQEQSPHDLDFSVPYAWVQKNPNVEDFFKLFDEPNIEQAHEGYYNNNKVTFSYYILKEGYTFDKSKTIKNINNAVKQPFLDLTILDNKGKEVKVLDIINDNILMGVDFFYPLADRIENYNDNVSSSQSVFEGKLNLQGGNESNEVFFQRLKDQNDYILSNFENLQNPLLSHLYFNISDNELKNVIKSVNNSTSKKDLEDNSIQCNL